MAKNEKTFWNNPKIDLDEGRLVGVDFRDGYVRLEDDQVVVYFDKDREVMLVPNNVDENGVTNEWAVLDKDNNPTGAIWVGTIDVLNSSVIIEQAHNGLKRSYLADGSIETEYRTSRVTEMPGRRKIVYKDGTRIEENIKERTSVTTYDDRVVSRKSDGSATINFTNGSDVVVEVNSHGQIFRIRDRNGERKLVWKADKICEIKYV